MLSPDEKRGMDSRPPQLHYPQGSFSDKPGPQLMRHRGSLDRTFVSGCLVVKHPVRLPYALTLFSRFLTLMRKPLGTSDNLSEVYRPSQTARQMLSPRKVSDMKTSGWCYIVAFPRPHDLGATLPPTLYTDFHTTTSSCSKVPWGLLVPLEDS